MVEALIFDLNAGERYSYENAQRERAVKITLFQNTAIRWETRRELQQNRPGSAKRCNLSHRTNTPRVCQYTSVMQFQERISKVIATREETGREGHVVWDRSPPVSRGL